MKKYLSFLLPICIGIMGGFSIIGAFSCYINLTHNTNGYIIYCIVSVFFTYLSIFSSTLIYKKFCNEL